MGIRFFCPQGHKLNVKSFLAGKTGYCPYCNAKVEIPLTSTRQSSKAATAAATPQRESDPAAAVAPVAQPVAEAHGSAPVAQPATAPGNVAGATNVAQAATPQAPTSRAASTPTGNVAQQDARQIVGGGTAAVDPIDESPQAVWYVRPATGGQYGPASGDAMRQWLDEGRVAADSLVWREGWPDWRTAADAFPKFTVQAAPLQARRT